MSTVHTGHNIGHVTLDQFHPGPGSWLPGPPVTRGPGAKHIMALHSLQHTVHCLNTVTDCKQVPCTLYNKYLPKPYYHTITTHSKDFHNQFFNFILCLKNQNLVDSQFQHPPWPLLSCSRSQSCPMSAPVHRRLAGSRVVDRLLVSLWGSLREGRRSSG